MPNKDSLRNLSPLTTDTGFYPYLPVCRLPTNPALNFPVILP